MRALSDREKRTVRLGAAAVGIYLVIFTGLTLWNRLEKSRDDYQQLIRTAERVKRELQLYEDKTVQVRKLRDAFHLNIDNLSKASLVAETSAAIQKAARNGGVQVGPVRESPARSTGKELTSIQLDITGQIKGVMALLHQLDTLGYPLLIDSMQISSAAGGPGGQGGPRGGVPPMAGMPVMRGMPPMGGMGPPGMMKLSLTIVILDYEQWKKEEVRRG